MLTEYGVLNQGPNRKLAGSGPNTGTFIVEFVFPGTTTTKDTIIDNKSGIKENITTVTCVDEIRVERNIEIIKGALCWVQLLKNA